MSVCLSLCLSVCNSLLKRIFFLLLLKLILLYTCQIPSESLSCLSPPPLFGFVSVRETERQSENSVCLPVCLSQPINHVFLLITPLTKTQRGDFSGPILKTSACF